MSLDRRGVLQENYEQIDAHENLNRPEVMKDEEGTSKKSDHEITTNNIGNLEEKSNEENNDQKTGDEIKTEDDDGKFQVVFLFFFYLYNVNDVGKLQYVYGLILSLLQMWSIFRILLQEKLSNNI